MSSKGNKKEWNPSDLQPGTNIQWPDPSPILLELGQADNLDTAMFEVEAFGNNHIPQNFLPGPNLTHEQAFDGMAACSEEILASLDIPISDRVTLTEEEIDRQTSEARRQSLINQQTKPAEADKADQYDLAEVVTFTQTGYFYPGMPEK